MADKIDQLAERLSKLETNVIAPMAATLELLGRRLQDGEDESPKLAPGHRPWKCEGCRSLLGIYDNNEDCVRIRVKDFFVQASPGQGGWVQVQCRRCGQPNRVSQQ